MSVSGNTKEEELKEWAVVLRAVSTQATGQAILYTAADLLLAQPSSHHEEQYNSAIFAMVAALLGYPNTDPATVERVLRNLPPLT